MFDELKSFQQTHQYPSVRLEQLSSNAPLHKWVKNQREQYKLYQNEETRYSRKCKLDHEKILRLESIGMQWEEVPDAGANAMNAAVAIALTAAQRQTTNATATTRPHQPSAGATEEATTAEEDQHPKLTAFYDSLDV